MLKFVFRVLITITLMIPVYVNALELNVSNHFLHLGGVPSDHKILEIHSKEIKRINKLMSKYNIENWNDENIDVKIGLASNSLFLLISNKTDTTIQYKIEIKDEKGNKIGLKQGRWYDLIPRENNHVGGTPLFFKKSGIPKLLDIKIYSQKKIFKTDVERYFSVFINSNINDPASVFEDSLFKKSFIFPRYEIYRKDPSKTEFNTDLKKIDKILKLINTERNQIGLIDVREYFGEKYRNTTIMGIYDNRQNKVIVTTGASMPNTTLIKYTHPSISGINFYYFSEHITDYAGELIGSTYSVLFKKSHNNIEILYENRNIGYVQHIKLVDLVLFDNKDELFVIGSKNNGVQRSRFVAKLFDKKFLDELIFNVNYEGGHSECPEDPFNLCG